MSNIEEDGSDGGKGDDKNDQPCPRRYEGPTMTIEDMISKMRHVAPVIPSFLYPMRSSISACWSRAYHYRTLINLVGVKGVRLYSEMRIRVSVA